MACAGSRAHSPAAGGRSDPGRDAAQPASSLTGASVAALPLAPAAGRQYLWADRERVTRTVNWWMTAMVLVLASGCREPDQKTRARVDENLRRIASAQQKAWWNVQTDLQPLVLKSFPNAAPWRTPVAPPREPVVLLPGADGLLRERYEIVHDPVGREHVLMAVLKFGGGEPKVLASQRVPRWFEVRAIGPSGQGGALDCRALRVTLRQEESGPIVFFDEYLRCQVDGGAA
jgi:hypothetical protein